jgi:hypothetical protein
MWRMNVSMPRWQTELYRLLMRRLFLTNRSNKLTKGVWSCYPNRLAGYPGNPVFSIASGMRESIMKA